MATKTVTVSVSCLKNLEGLVHQITGVDLGVTPFLCDVTFQLNSFTKARLQYDSDNKNQASVEISQEG